MHGDSLLMLTTKVVSNKKPPLLSDSESGGSTSLTVGFIDPGNWASNLAAGADFGYLLLWMVTLSTIMLILLQHNAAHLGIVTGLCLSEASTKYLPKWLSRPILATAMMASIATALAWD